MAKRVKNVLQYFKRGLNLFVDTRCYRVKLWIFSSLLEYLWECFVDFSQPVITCLKLIIETVEQGVRCVKS